MVAGQELRAKIPLPPVIKTIIKGNGTTSILLPDRDSKESRKYSKSLASVLRLQSCWRNELLELFISRLVTQM